MSIWEERKNNKVFNVWINDTYKTVSDAGERDKIINDLRTKWKRKADNNRDWKYDNGSKGFSIYDTKQRKTIIHVHWTDGYAFCNF